MHTLFLYFCFNLFLFSNSLTGMDGKPPQRSWLGKLFHLWDQTQDPLTYFSSDRAPIVCSEALRFDPTHPEHRQFTGDERDEDIIHSAFNRQKALLVALEEATCKTNSLAAIQQIKDARARLAGFYSRNAEAVIDGFLETKMNAAAEQVRRLQRQTHPLPSTAAEKINEKKTDFPSEIDFPPMEAVQDIVLRSHPDALSKGRNLLRKKIFNPVEYVTDAKACTVGRAIRHFDPDHPYHNPNWPFNPDLLLHKTLVHQAFAREGTLLDIIESAISQHNIADISKLNPNNPDNAHFMEKIGGSFSPVAKAIIAAYLKKMETDATRDFRTRRDQYEQRRTGLSTQINSFDTGVPTHYIELATLTGSDTHNSTSVPTNTSPASVAASVAKPAQRTQSLTTLPSTPPIPIHRALNRSTDPSGKLPIKERPVLGTDGDPLADKNPPTLEAIARRKAADILHSSSESEDGESQSKETKTHRRQTSDGDALSGVDFHEIQSSRGDEFKATHY